MVPTPWTLCGQFGVHAQVWIKLLIKVRRWPEYRPPSKSKERRHHPAGIRGTGWDADTHIWQLGPGCWLHWGFQTRRRPSSSTRIATVLRWPVWIPAGTAPATASRPRRAVWPHRQCCRLGSSLTCPIKGLGPPKGPVNRIGYIAECPSCLRTFRRIWRWWSTVNPCGAS